MDMTVHDFIVSLRDGKYAHGGYPKFWLTHDGDTLSYEACRSEIWQIARAIRDQTNDGWRVVACDANWEDPRMYCAHTGERIESAYAEDKKWAYGNGMPGCLHDNQSGPYDTAEQAAAGAAECLELTDEERDELARDHIIYFRGERAMEVGASMVELFEVDPDWECE